MRAGTLRRRYEASIATAMRGRSAADIAAVTDRAKAVGVALAGVEDGSEVALDRLALSTQSAALVLGFHPEHVRRLIRGGRLAARREGGDHRIPLEAVLQLLDSRSRTPGRRRAGRV